MTSLRDRGVLGLTLCLLFGCARDVTVGREDAIAVVGGQDAGDWDWIADHEAANFDQWLSDGAGRKYVEGSGALGISSEHAHSGEHSFSASVSADDGELHQAVMGRTLSLAEGRYQAWYYLPVAPTDGDWVIMKLSNDPGTDRFDIDLEVTSPGDPHLRLYEHDQGWITEPATGAFPVGRWVQVAVQYRSTPDNDGRLIVLQDGAEVLDSGRRPTAEDFEVTFYVGIAARHLLPSPYELFIDDAAIRAEAVP